MSFAARAGVCGDWANGISRRQDNEEWQADCGPQLVRVALRVRDHRVHSVRTYVGGRWLPDRWSTDLGMVRPQEAAEYFIGLAERTGVAGDPLLPSVLADSVTIWPWLLRLARTPRVSKETRNRAVFWLSQAAGAAVGIALDSIAQDPRGDREVRKQAIFALSQRSHDEGVPALIRIARASHAHQDRSQQPMRLGIAHRGDGARGVADENVFSSAPSSSMKAARTARGP